MDLWQLPLPGREPGTDAAQLQRVATAIQAAKELRADASSKAMAPVQAAIQEAAAVRLATAQRGVSRVQDAISAAQDTYGDVRAKVVSYAYRNDLQPQSLMPGMRSQTETPTEQVYDYYVQCGTGNLYGRPTGSGPYQPGDVQVLTAVSPESGQVYYSQTQAWWNQNPPPCPAAGQQLGPGLGGVGVVGGVGPPQLGPGLGGVGGVGGSSGVGAGPSVPLGGGLRGAGGGQLLGGGVQLLGGGLPGQGFGIQVQGGPVPGPGLGIQVQGGIGPGQLYDVYVACPGSIVYRVPAGANPSTEGPFNATTNTRLAAGQADAQSMQTISAVQAAITAGTVAYCPADDAGSGGPVPPGPGGGIGGEGFCPAPPPCPACDPCDPCPDPPVPAPCAPYYQCRPQDMRPESWYAWDAGIDSDDFRGTTARWLGSVWGAVGAFASIDEMHKDAKDKLQSAIDGDEGGSLLDSLLEGGW